jgi:hypothetical protein
MRRIRFTEKEKNLVRELFALGLSGAYIGRKLNPKCSRASIYFLKRRLGLSPTKTLQ